MELQQIQTVMAQANELLKEAQYDEALDLLNTLDTDTELGGLLCYMKGCAYLQLEQDEQAHLSFGAALEKGFVRKELYINFGIVKSRMGNVLQAEQMFRQAADLDPVDALPLNRIILLRLGRGEFAGAETVMDELMHRNPELVDGYHHKADLLLGTGRAAEAVELLEMVEPRFTANSLFVYDYCRALGRAGRAEDAVAYLQTHMAAFREPSDLLLLKKQSAVLLVQLKRPEAAVPLWQELYDLYGDRQAGMALAADAIGRGDMETLYRIAEEMTAAEVGDDSHYMCLFYKAIAQKHLGNQEEERAALLAAAEQFDQLGDDRQGIQFRSVRATIRAELGRYEDALSDVTDLIDLARRSTEDAEKVEAMIKDLSEMKADIEQRMNTFS